MKRAISMVLTFVLMLGLMTSIQTNVAAASIVDINDSSVFLKQNAGDTCTLVSALMMFRRGALINKNTNWNSFTESNYKNTWWGDSGLPWTLSAEGMYAERTKLGDTNVNYASRKQTFQNLLSSHKEGIVIFLAYGDNAANWHAVLLTDYDSAFTVPILQTHAEQGE